MVSYLFFLSNSDGYWFVSSKKYYSDWNWKYEQFAVNNENWKNWIVDFSFFKTMEHVKKENLFEKKNMKFLQSIKSESTFAQIWFLSKKLLISLKTSSTDVFFVTRYNLLDSFSCYQTIIPQKNKSLKLQYHTSFMDISKLLNIQMNIIGLMETTWLIRCKI